MLLRKASSAPRIGSAAYWIATRDDAVRKYQVPSTSAGEARVCSPSVLTCSRLNSRPAFTT